MNSMILTVYILLMAVILNGQNVGLISDDFSQNNNWNYINQFKSSQIKILNGSLAFNRSTDGKEERYIKKLPSVIDSNDDWTIECEFEPTNAGVQNFSGHIVTALSSGSSEPLANCIDTQDCSKNWTPRNQDGIIVLYGTTHPPELKDTNTFFTLHVKDGANEWFSKKQIPPLAIYAPLNKKYILKISKCFKFIILDVVDHYGNLIGSIKYEIKSNQKISDLEYIHIGNSARGVPSRILSATVDNLEVIKIVNKPPVLTGFNGSNSNNFKIWECEGKYCGRIYSKDVNTNQNLSINLLSNLPKGSTVNISQGSRPSIEFCWDPDKNDVGKHYVMFEVVDDHCVSESNKYIYEIEVISGYDLGGPYEFCENDQSYKLPDPGPGRWTFNGVTIPNATLDPSLFQPGNYVLTYCTDSNSTATCVGCWNVDLTINEKPEIVFSDGHVYCSSDPPFQLYARPFGGVWNGGPYITPSGIFTPSLANFSQHGNILSYTYTDSKGCTSIGTKTIFVKSNPLGISIDKGEVCVDEYVSFGDSAIKIEYFNLWHPITKNRPQNAPTFPITLNRRGFNFSSLSSYGSAPYNYIYFFRVTYLRDNGCEFYNEYAIRFVECGCTDNALSNINATANATKGLLAYDFSFSPNISQIQNLIRFNWYVEDKNGSVLKSLYQWDNTKQINPLNPFNYDFTSEFGSIFQCDSYFVYVQIVSQDQFGELSLCKDVVEIEICDEEKSLQSTRRKKIGKLDRDDYVRIYPNPFNEDLNVSFTLAEKSQISIQLIDSYGRVFRQYVQTEVFDSGKHSILLDMSNISSGIYYLKFSGESLNTIKKLIKN